MDSTDEKILDVLKESGRKSYTDIAEEIGVSEGTVRNRVQTLVDNGVIEKFTVEVNRDSRIKAFVTVRVAAGTDFRDLRSEFPDDLESYEVAGDIDMVVEITGNSSSDINEKVDEIRALNGVESTRTYMVLSED